MPSTANNGSKAWSIVRPGYEQLHTERARYGRSERVLMSDILQQNDTHKSLVCPIQATSHTGALRAPACCTAALNHTLPPRNRSKEARMRYPPPSSSWWNRLHSPDDGRDDGGHDRDKRGGTTDGKGRLEYVRTASAIKFKIHLTSMGHQGQKAPPSPRLSFLGPWVSG